MDLTGRLVADHPRPSRLVDRLAGRPRHRRSPWVQYSAEPEEYAETRNEYAPLIFCAEAAVYQSLKIFVPI